MINWNKIEKATIYISLVLIGIITLISSVFPNLLPQNVIGPITTTLITLTLLSLFKYISNKLESAEVIDRSTFTKSTNLLFDKVKSKKIKSLDLFAYSGKRYREILCEKEIIRIEHVRLMFSQGDMSDIYKNELAQELVVWQSLQKKG